MAVFGQFGHCGRDPSYGSNDAGIDVAEHCERRTSQSEKRNRDENELADLDGSGRPLRCRPALAARGDNDLGGYFTEFE